ncbi:type II secretion system protein GspM [Henriciella aquimarina]|uniref:type II secretion system protein GspM n=1 Tax=Henriciella aquimarina TaxID=545261 RepID=UPI0009FEE716|nr:type II secretion system protein GspM [Henriciella aquimarina]
MSSWWSGLSLREKLLIALAGGLLALLVAWYGIVTPSLDARAEARQARQTAADQLARLERLVALERARTPATTGMTVSTASALKPDAFKAAVTQAAQASGLAISRLQGNDDGRFALVFEGADARQFFYWLTQVEGRLGGRIERMSLDQAQDGRVRATVELSGETAG